MLKLFGLKTCSIPVVCTVKSLGFDGYQHRKAARSIVRKRIFAGAAILAILSGANVAVAQSDSGTVCAIGDRVPFNDTYSYEQTFGSGSGRSSDPNVVNHTYKASGGIGDDYYAVGPSSDLGQHYSRTDEIGDLDADGTTNGRYLFINMRGANDGVEGWTGVFYKQEKVPLIPDDLDEDELPEGATLAGFQFSTALAGTCARSSCTDVPEFTLILEDSSNNSQLASTTSADIGVANDDKWRTVVLDIDVPLSTTNADLILFNSQRWGANGNDVGVDNITFAPVFCMPPELKLTKTAEIVDDPDVVEAGDVIKYTFTLTNNSDATAYNVSLTDDEDTGFTGTGTLPAPTVSSGGADLDEGKGTATDVAVGETLVYTVEYTLTQADIDAGFVDNGVKASYQDYGDNESTVVAETVTTLASSPSLALVKTATVTDVNG
ncbi:hypothetical protein Q4494_06770, partial [Celeribacter halophilus]